MLAFILPLLLVLLFSTTTTTITAQPYNATDRFFLDCGSSTASNSNSDHRYWDGDEHSKFVPSNITTTSFSSTPDHQDPSVPQIPYSTARIFNTSSFTYKFPVSQGPKFLRLHFYPATYSNLNANQSFLSVSSNGYSLLTNFSAFLAASYLAKARSDAGVSGPQVPHLVKEFLVYVKDTQILSVTFTPSPNSYAFINGIEIVSMPENVYFNSKTPKYVNQYTGPIINNHTALENMYRLNMGGGQISVQYDTGMYRSWDQDNNYIYGAAIGLTPLYHNPIMYTTETPNYTAPEAVYQTQRSMGQQSDKYNLTWILPVDSGFYYMIRLHFCNIIPQYTKAGQVIFRIFVNNKTAEQEADIFYWTQGNGYPVFKDYIVFVNDPDGKRSKRDLWLAMHPSHVSQLYLDAYLNGLEVFKLSMNKNLASPNPELSSTTTPTRRIPIVESKKKKTQYAAIIGGIGGLLVLVFILVLIVYRQQRRIKRYGAAYERSSYGPAYSESKSSKSLNSPAYGYHPFSLTDVKAATDEFNDNFVIGNGEFGKWYRAYMDDTKTIVAIKRVDSSITKTDDDDDDDDDAFAAATKQAGR